MSKKTQSPVNEEVSAKKRALDAAVAQIEKAHGKGAIMSLGSLDVSDIPVIGTGCIQLDMSLGIGGLPKGRVVEIYGPESSGKTTLTLHAIAECQRAGGVAAFIDAEHAFDAQYARKVGVDIDNLLVSQPDNGEQALDICETLVRSGAVDLVVVDSVAALVPQAEINGEMGDSHMGVQARLMSQALRKLTGLLNKSHCCLIFINQLRMKIGVMFGNPETTTGGNALKFYASVRLDIRKIASIKDGEEVIGNRTKVKVVKNKLAAPFKQCEFDILYGVGISREGSVLDMATDMEIVQKSGTWFSYGKDRLGQGREKARDYLKENRAMAEEIEAKIRQSLATGKADVIKAKQVDASEEEWSDIQVTAREEA